MAKKLKTLETRVTFFIINFNKPQLYRFINDFKTCMSLITMNFGIFENEGFAVACRYR